MSKTIIRKWSQEFQLPTSTRTAKPDVASVTKMQALSTYSKIEEKRQLEEDFDPLYTPEDE